MPQNAWLMWGWLLKWNMMLASYKTVKVCVVDMDF